MAGRALLIKAVIFGIQMYWSQIFPLSSTVIREIDRLCRSFLWCGKTTEKFNAAVSWNDVCSPKEEGGLGIISIEKWNMAALFKNIWSIARKSDTLWIRWVHAYYLKDQNIWSIQGRGGDSWFWKRLLGIRTMFLDAINEVQSQWVRGKFSVKATYEHITEHQDIVEWKKVVWGKGTVARHRVLLWLAIRNRLKTKDRLAQWNEELDEECVLCTGGRESRDHLFFQCTFAKEVLRSCWDRFHIKCKYEKWEDVLKWIERISVGKARGSQIRRSLFANLVYAIWRERNIRIFEKEYHKPKDIVDSIVATILCKFGSMS